MNGRLLFGGVLGAAILMILGTGCLARRVVYVSAPPPPVQVVTTQVQTSTNGPTQTVIVTQQPPAPLVEVIPAAPSPFYAWVPGYWSWNGTWVWIGGSWAHRPHPGAVWVGGNWAHRGRGFVWFGGRWR